MAVFWELLLAVTEHYAGEAELAGFDGWRPVATAKLVVRCCPRVEVLAREDGWPADPDLKKESQLIKFPRTKSYSNDEL
jgi:hypothetical protein